MTDSSPVRIDLRPTEEAYAGDGEGEGAIPIHAVRGAGGLPTLDLDERGEAWVKANGFKGQAKQFIAVPDVDGSLAQVLFGLGDDGRGEPSGGDCWLAAGTYRLGKGWHEPEAATIAWGLGAYTFRRYKQRVEKNGARLVVPGTVSREAVESISTAIWFGRDLINTPSNDMGPAELEQAAALLAERHAGARLAVIRGGELLANNLPLIHAVGRASSRAPRLIDLTWAPAGRPAAPAAKVTIIGKGVCFDTGGLDIKPASGMLLMKKDMGGAATSLALAHMIMSLGLDVQLRVLIPAVENSISGNAFRPGDILPSRAGLTVEIGNTDAEGRLVLADALALADEEKPDLMMTFATLTGAARVALGPELPPYYVDDDGLAARISAASLRVADPVWRMPFWAGYDRLLDSPNADMGNVSEGAFAGSVTAALFLKRFVRQTRDYVHFDIYGWRQAAKPLGPKGGEPHAARAMLEIVRELAAATS